MSLISEMRAIFGDGSVSFGLDFGTYRSMLAVCSEDGPMVPAYKDACLGGVPSLFWRTESGEEYVGDEVYARNGQAVDPGGICASVKTRLQNGPVRLHGKEYSPREIAGRIIKRVLDVTQPLLEQEFIEMDFSSIVCGVPVRFTAAQKGEISSIVREATGGKEVHLVPEPILAALSVDYYLEKKKHRPVRRPVLVYDMGAGTFDVCLLVPNTPSAYDPYPYRALNPQGSAMAGDCIDSFVEEMMLEKLRQVAGFNMSTLEKEQHMDRQTLRLESRRVKEKLSECEEIDQLITTSAGSRAMLHLTRSELEQNIEPRMRRETIDLAVKVVQEEGYWNNNQLDIVLVGGSTYMPLVRRLLLEAFPWLDESHIQQRLPEKAVALGAAIYAAIPKLVVPKVAYGYAVSTYNTTRKLQMLHVRITSNAELPMTVKAIYSTRFNNQLGVQFYVFEVDHGELDEFLNMEEGNALMDAGQAYHIMHSFGKPVPVDTNVELTVTLDRSGRLLLRVSDMGLTGKDTEEIVDLCSTSI